MPPRKSAASDTPKVFSTRTLVDVLRDQNTRTPRVVYAHEIPILEAIFGEGNVTVQETDALDEGFSARISPDLLPYNKVQDAPRPPSATQRIGFVFVGDHRQEFDRLCTIYGRHPEVNETFAEYVYGRFNTGRFSALVGEPTLEDLPDDQVRTLVKEYGFIPPETEKSTDEQRAAVRAKVLQLADATRDDLLKMAAELGVEV